MIEPFSGSAADACKRCCRRNLNSSCNAVAPVDILPDGTPCFQGFCHLGQCEKSNPDHIVRIIDIFKDISLTSILKFLKDNVVGTVIFVSLLFWVPLSCLISWVDRKRADQAAADWEWRRQDELIHPSDKRRIIHLRVPKRNNSTTAAGGGGGTGGSGGGGMEQQTPEHRDLVHRNVVHQSAM